MTKTQTTTVRGKLSFAKVLGDPVLNYDKSGKEWKLDLEIDTNTVKELKALGIADRVKQKETYLNGAPHISLKQKEFRNDGVTRNDPIPVVNILGEAWDERKLLGNETVADVQIAVMDFGPGKKKGVYPRRIRVLDLKEYNTGGMDAVAEGDEFYEAAKKAEADRAARKAAEDRGFIEDFDINTDNLDDDIEDVL